MRSILFAIFLSSGVYAADIPVKLKKDIKASTNFKNLFLDSLDPAAILKDSTPKFVDMNGVDHLSDKDDFETMGTIYGEKTSIITVPGYLLSEKVKALGTLIGGFSDEEMIAPSNRVAIKIEGDLQKDKSYSLLHLRRTMKASGTSWYYYTYGGDLTITEITNKKQAIGQTDAIAIANVGDVLVPLIDAQRKVDTSLGVRKAFNGRAKIMSMVDENSKIVGGSGFVFLDKGKNDGLELNQQLDVFLDKEVHKMKFENSEAVGTLQIIDLNPTSSMAYVIKSQREISIGDYAL